MTQDQREALAELREPKHVSPAIGQFLMEQQAKKIEAIMVSVCKDPRGQVLLEYFDSLDERGKVTALRMLQVMPKGPL